MPLTIDPAASAVLHQGRQAYIAVETASGPHVTPELYTSSSSQLAFFAAATTLKAKVLQRRPVAGALVLAGSRALVLGGTVDVVDAARPRDLARALSRPVSVGRSVGGFVARNLADLGGFAADAARGRVGGLPPRRLLFTLTPERWALLDGGRLVAAEGPWTGTPGTPASGAGGLSGAVVGWGTPDGPLAVPAAWDGDEGRALVPTPLATLAGMAGEAPACITFDDYGAPGPAAKRGMVLRGSARVETDGAGTWAYFAPDRAAIWEGVHSETTRVAEG